MTDKSKWSKMFLGYIFCFIKFVYIDLFSYDIYQHIHMLIYLCSSVDSNQMLAFINLVIYITLFIHLN